MNTYKKLKSDPTKTQLIITGNKNNGTVLVDTEDVPRLKNHSWFIKDSNNKGENYSYTATKINNKTVKLHRFLLNETDPEVIIDHIDRDRLNNCKSNLEKTNRFGNARNYSKRCTNTSGRTGVRFSKGQNGRSDRYNAQITYNKKKYNKAFSISIYGEEKAYKLACEQREAWENEFGFKTEK